jgi:hypothetical protein
MVRSRSILPILPGLCQVGQVTRICGGRDRSTGAARLGVVLPRGPAGGPGPARHARRISLGAASVLAVHPSLPWSRNTKDLVARAPAAGIPVSWLDAEDAEPRRVLEA